MAERVPCKDGCYTKRALAFAKNRSAAATIPILTLTKRGVCVTSQKQN